MSKLEPDKRNSESGSTLIELAIALPVAMLMTFGFIYFALLIFGICNNAFASRAATRYASIHSNTSSAPTTQAALNAIVDRFATSYPANTCTVTVSYVGGNVVGGKVTVKEVVSYTFGIMGTTYSPLSFSWSTSGLIIE
jgi:Flp pilus assembly protein TadG